MSNENVKRAAHTVTLDGKQYLLAALGDRDITELDLYVRSVYINNVRKSFTSDMSDNDKNREMDQAQLSAATLSAFSGTGAQILGSFNGVARLAWQSIKRNHPDIALDDFTSKLFDSSINPTNASDNLDGFNRAFKQANASQVVDASQLVEANDTVSKKKSIMKRRKK